MVKTRFFVIIIAIILIAAVVATILIYTLNKNESLAVVSIDGEVVYQVDLSKVTDSYEKVIETPYGTNTILIDKNRICVKDADCKDETCVNQGWIVNGSTPIVCLPHHLVIKIVKGEDDIDAISQ